ncbi:MAG TPA: YihY/virulence factor BrkB family protein [Terrimicrobiaceae bacterium]|nr:YihY/virulence factor BrkB family protein [Terrimicrobiaceae bacterium]
MGRAKRNPLRRTWRVIVQTWNIYLEIDGEQRAAAFGYYVLFSLFPLFALLLIVGSSFFGSDDIIATIKGFLPMEDPEQRFIWDAVHQLEVARGGIGVLSVLILLWTSLRFFQGLVHGVNRAWHTVEIPWWQIPLKNLLMVLIIGSALFAGLIAPAILQGVRNALNAAETFLHTHFPKFDLNFVSGVLDLSRYALGVVLLFYSFCMLYKFAPRRRVLFRQVWLPALIVTFALMICQIAFINYLPHFVNYGIYGAVGGMMLLLLWVYFSGIIIILGACLCAAIEQCREQEDGVIPSSREY